MGLKFLKQIPVAICGLILGLVSLGNLFFSIDRNIVGWFFTAIGIILIILFLMKITFTAKDALKTLDNPVVASIAPTFPMSLMVLCNTLSLFTVHDALIYAVWWLSIILHFGLMVFFTIYFLTPKRLSSDHINPGWFVTFVGIGVIPTTSSSFGVEFGQIVIWIALAFYIILLPVILKQIFTKKVGHATFPLIAIIAAPGSLCLTGYISVIEHPSEVIIYTLLILSQALYFLIIAMLPKILKLKFYPSYAATTFPIVISATAIVYVVNRMPNEGLFNDILSLLSVFELSLAVLLVTYIMIRYCLFIVECYTDSRQTYY